MGAILWRWLVGWSHKLHRSHCELTIPVNAVIFMAPMSGFNQVLAEDESINRLVCSTQFTRPHALIWLIWQTDTLRIWQAVCSNKLLADVEFILFLNKLDILESKLSSGIKFSSFVTSYSGKNEAKPVAKCEFGLRKSFHALIIIITVRQIF